LIPRGGKSRLAVRGLHQRAVIRTENFSRRVKEKTR
jgi:predicted thioesterase